MLSVSRLSAGIPPSVLTKTLPNFSIFQLVSDGGLWELVEAALIPDETDLPSYLRRHTRFAIPETLIIEMLDENGDVAASEVSVTENISLSGVAVFTSFNVDAGSFLRVRSERLEATIISVVRGKRVGC